ncbi:glycosyltransferase family 4 protein [Patescibacteria group bacterium AH-259-L05]|nr:glycosyltransferase family 4 protein [Patescibacteria group bacterium AH-259-L05]
MKVCILTSVHPTFDVRIFHKQAKTLAGAGYNVTLIAQHDQNETVDGIKIIALPKPKNRFRRILIDWKLLKLAFKQKSDIYHFHDPELLPFGVLLKILTRAKIIYDVHEHYPNVILDRIWIPVYLRKIASKSFAFIEKILVPFLDLVIYTTPIIGQRYQKMKVKTERIENYPLLDLSELYKSSTRKKHIIYLGWMSEIRGIYELIKAFALVIEKYPEWKLYLVGTIAPASFAEKIEKLIKKLNISQHIRMIPWVSFKEKEKYSKQACIGIVTYLPYANNISCLPNKLFEYMLAELPVIASNFALYKEIVEGNKCGITVDPTNIQEITRAIEYLIKHPEKARKMGKNGRKAISEKYNWENESKKLLKAYKNFKA